MALNSFADKEALKKYIESVSERTKGSKYEPLCRRLLRDFAILNQQRIKKILLSFQKAIIKAAAMKPEPVARRAVTQTRLQILQIESASHNDVIVLSSDDDESKPIQKQQDEQHDSVITANNQVDSEDEEETVAKTAVRRKRGRRVIKSDDSLSEGNTSERRRRDKRRRIINPSCTSSSSSPASSDIGVSTSFYTASKTHSKSSQFIESSSSVESETENSCVSHETLNRWIGRYGNRRPKRNELEKLREATVKSFIGKDMLKISAFRKTKRVNYNLDKESSGEDDSDAAKVDYICTPRTRKKRKATSNTPSTSRAADVVEVRTRPPPIPVIPISTDESSSDEPRFSRPLTVADIMCNPRVERSNFSQIKGTVRVHIVDGVWKVKEASAPSQQSWDSDSDGPRDGPIPITRSYSSRSRSDRTDASRMSMDFEVTENQSTAADSRPLKDEHLSCSSNREVLRTRSGSDSNVQAARVRGVSEQEKALPAEKSRDITPRSHPTHEGDDSLMIVETSMPEIIEIDDDSPDPLPALSTICVKKEVCETAAAEAQSAHSATKSSEVKTTKPAACNQQTIPSTSAQSSPLRQIHVPIKASPVPKIIINAEVKIANLAFTRGRLGVVYKCYAASCYFSSTDEEVFKYHLQSRHPVDKWSGFCNICNESFSNIAPLIDEFMHIKAKHTSESEKRRKSGESDKRRGKSRSTSNDSNQSQKASSTAKGLKVRKELTFQLEPTASTTAAAEKLPVSSEGTTEQLKTVEELIEELSSENAVNANKEKSPEQLENPVAIATIQVPVSVNNNVVNAETITLPVVHSADASSGVKTTIKSVDFINDKEVADIEAGKNKPMLRVKMLPGDKLSTPQFQDGPSTSSESQSSPQTACEAKLPKLIALPQPTTSTEPANVNIGQRIPILSTIATQNMTYVSKTSSEPRTVVRPVMQHVSHLLHNDQRSTMTPPIFTGITRPAVTVQSPLSTVPRKPSTTNSALQAPSIVAEARTLKLIVIPVTKSLRPWLNAQNTIKTQQAAATMVKDACLKDLYKCMHETCDFHTCNNELFVAHLKSHKSNNPLTNSSCCYCNYRTTDDKALVDHIALMHGRCKYYCNTCFYRTSCTYNIKRHARKYHNAKSIVEIGQLDNIGELNEVEELIRVKVTRQKLVAPISCSACKAKYYNYKDFESHREKEHPTGILYKCNICQGEATELNLLHHLIKCHHVNHFHCCYCKFGSESIDDIADHLMNTHPEKLPFYIERVNTSQATDPSSIDTTTIRKLSILSMDGW